MPSQRERVETNAELLGPDVYAVECSHCDQLTVAGCDRETATCSTCAAEKG